MPIRFSIAGLMAGVLFVAVSIASLREATELWARTMFTLAIAACGVALLGLLFRRGISRAGWTGFFVFGAGYLTLGFAPGCDTHIMPRLVTTALIDDRYMKLDYSPSQVGERVWAADRIGE